jgi:hypothetical protein
VCLAEGTTTYVKLSSIALVLTDTDFEAYKPQLAADDLKVKADEALRRLEGVAVEPFRCAEELFYSADRLERDANEAFPFGGCGGGSNTANCGIDRYIFPMDYSEKTETSQKYELVFGAVKCDSGYEVPREDCAEAALSVGGLLYSDGDVKEDAWGESTCYLWSFVMDAT